MTREHTRWHLSVLECEGQIWYLVGVTKEMTPFAPQWALRWLRNILTLNGFIIGDEFRMNDVVDLQFSGTPDCAFLNVLYHKPIEGGLMMRSIPLSLERLPHTERLSLGIFRDHLGQYHPLWQQILFLAAHVYFTHSQCAQYALLQRLNVTDHLDRDTSMADWNNLTVRVRDFGTPDSLILDLYYKGDPYRIGDEYRPH